MAESSSQEFLRPYREALRAFGPSFEATLWNSPEAQRIRFQVMIDLVRLDGCTILDLGCGRGDFAVELIGQGVAFRRYVGLDAMAAMVEAARDRALERCVFEVKDVLEDPAALLAAKADYACISGTLNTMDDPSARRLVSAAFVAAGQGVIFNFLSDRHHPRWGGRDLSPARRFDTIAWLDWSLTLTSRVSFTQDYLDGHDATIVLRHDA